MISGDWLSVKASESNAGLVPASFKNLANEFLKLSPPPEVDLR